MTGDNRAIRSICVVGGGTVGLSAAILFARALPGTQLLLLRTEVDPSALADRMPGTIPAIGRFHAAIGLDELDLVRTGVATHRLGTRFERWSASGEPWYHCFGDYGVPAGPVAFHQLWLRARAAGEALPFHRYSAAAMLAEADKFVHPEQEPNSLLSSFRYALRLDPGGYQAALEKRAASVALQQVRGQLGGVERREDGGLAAVLTTDGRRFEADLFVDCSGPAASLLSEVGGDFEDWSESLPCDRLLLAERPAQGATGPCDLAVASSSGWRWSAPLPGREMAGFAYASSLTSEDSARRIFRAEAGAEDAEVIAVRPGRRPEPWVRNVLALGDAAVALDPLEWTNLELAHSGALLAIELLPGRDFHPLELREYNRRSRQISDRVRDFVAAHYLACPRRSGDFWKGMGRRPLPESLARTLEQFGRRGRLPFFEQETFDKQSWTALLIGMGVEPEQLDPALSNVDAGVASAGMKRMAESIAALVSRLPSYPDYLQRMVRAPVR